jgi:acetyltransferase-like isoleucine patch superfamily enzyme
VVCGLSKIKKYSWLGANSTIKDNIIIDEGTVVGMASAIIRNTEKNSIYVGVPGKKIKDCDENIIL